MNDNLKPCIGRLYRYKQLKFATVRCCSQEQVYMWVFSYTCTGELRMEKRQLPSSSQSSPSGSRLGHCWDCHWSPHHCCCDCYPSNCGHGGCYSLLRVTSRHIHTCTHTQEYLCIIITPKCTLKCFIVYIPHTSFPIFARSIVVISAHHLGIVVVFLPCMYPQVVEPI